jgi:AcrR family transcriptional regulator
MEQNREPVKAKRRYDSRGRREQASQTRERIVEVARQLFLSGGYGPTTVAAIASAAGVSVETIYKAFGGKPGLVRAIVERGLAGEGPVPAQQRSDRIRETEPDPRRIFAAWGAFSAELHPRIHPVITLARVAAANDPEIGAVVDELDAARLARMTFNAQGLHDAGHLREGLTVKQVADILWTYSSSEVYDLLVTRRGWSTARYARFIADGLTAALLSSPQRPNSRSSRR